MSVTVEPPYLPFVDADHLRFRWRFGLHPLDPDDWIELGPDADAAIAEKRRINTAHHGTVFATIDGIEPEAAEVADGLVDHLRRRWPARFGDVVLDGELHPLDAAARLVPEDLVLLVERGGRLVVGGGSVCFPNRWDLSSKLGATLEEVHTPVPRLNDQLGSHLDRFFHHLAPDRSFWRVGWGIIDTPEWYSPPSVAHPLAPAVDHLHLRVERETFRRFAGTGCVLFTLRTYVTALPDVAEPGALAAAIEVLPDDVRRYKGLAGIADEVVAALVGIKG